MMDKRSTLVLLAGLFFSEARVAPRHSWKVSPRVANSTNYDFVIAGGGISGLIVADRLTEDPNINVLVIEAGPLDAGEPGILVPGSWDPSPYVWPDLATEPLTALNNRAPSVICARVVGGGSTINAMNWLRGTKVDYDDWEALGNEGWGWDDLLPFFMKSENFTAPDPEYAARANITWDDSVRGHVGPLQYSYSNYFYPASENWWNAAQSIGIEPVLDPNAGTNSGSFYLSTVLDAQNQTRCDARVAHYDRVIGSRPNYHLMTETTVARVLFDGTKAIGVEYLPTAGGSIQTVYASKEVIVAAGALHTPQVLQLSGVGPKSLLNSLNISVVADLPGVGTNLQDQGTLNVPYNLTSPMFPDSDSLSTNATYNAEQLANYNAHVSSAYTIVKGLSTTFTSLALTDATDSYQDIVAAAEAEDYEQYLPADTDSTVLAGYKAQREIILQQFQNPNISIGVLYWGTTTLAQIFQLKPLSRGTVKINSTNPLANPVIDYRTATDPVDFNVIIAFLRKLRELMAAPDMQALGPVEAAPLGAHVQDDEDIIEVMRENLVISNEHQCCSAPMMPLNMGGVIDANHKVYGTTNLRTADISFVPISVSGGPTPTMYAAGEKLADIIKREYSLAEYANSH
ncbi:hypothetical protein F4775DRAFT_605413 [Biscogniauxia sp. FL1348]|nr:hypothetical protein F4775DRAFT_605413 [Biscogniauxia sp. FL1348]